MWLNDRADFFAKEGRDSHRLPESAENLFIEGAEREKKVLMGMARVLASIPKPSDRLGHLARRRQTRKAPDRCGVPAKTPHEYVQKGDALWTCTQCLRSKRKREALLDSVACANVSEHVAKIAMWQESHTLMAAAIAGGPRVLVFCLRCGSFFERVPRGLVAPCPGCRDTRAKRWAANRILAERHPGTGELLGTPWAL